MTSSSAKLPAAPPGSKRLWLAIALLAYNLALLLLSPALVVWLLWRAAVPRKGPGNLLHRFGFVPRPPAEAAPRVWLHAVSAGEMAALKPVSDALRESLPSAYLAVSTVTSTGMSVGRRGGQSADALFYLPFDLLPTTLLALWRVRPNLLVVAEKELWPNLLGLARLLGAEVLVVNGRVSDRMMRRARLGAPVVRWLYSLPRHFCVQSPEDAGRLAQLGVPDSRVSVPGNTKVDAMVEPDREAEARLRQDLGVAEGDVWLVAGSTHAGEEELVLEAFAVILDAMPEARLLLAPRHVERVPAVLEMMARRSLECTRRSQCSAAESAGRGLCAPPSQQVVVLDTMGELRAAYGFGTAGFVGGTLVPVGGHNLLEPVASGRAVLFGPHTENCADVADLVLSAGIGVRVEGGRALAVEFLRIAKDPARQRDLARRGQALMEQQRGAARRCAHVAMALLQEKSA